MLYLVLAMVCSASMAIVLRLSENYSSNKYALFTGNYLTCIAMAYLSLPDKNPVPAGGGFAIWAGFLNGIVFLGSLLLLQLNIRKNGTVLASTFAKLGMLLPVICSVLLLGERPSPLQTGGLLLVIGAILIINLDKGTGRAAFKTGLLLQILFSGMADGMSKVFEQLGERRFDDLFLFYTFVFAFLLSLIPLFRVKQRIKAADMVSGLIVGIPNYLSTWLLLVAITKLPAYLVYPSYSVGTILMVSFVSVLLLKDQMTRKQIYGCGLILGALVLLNI